MAILGSNLSNPGPILKSAAAAAAAAAATAAMEVLDLHAPCLWLHHRKIERKEYYTLAEAVEAVKDAIVQHSLPDQLPQGVLLSRLRPIPSDLRLDYKRFFSKEWGSEQQRDAWWTDHVHEDLWARRADRRLQAILDATAEDIMLSRMATS